MDLQVRGAWLRRCYRMRGQEGRGAGDARRRLSSPWSAARWRRSPWSALMAGVVRMVAAAPASSLFSVGNLDGGRGDGRQRGDARGELQRAGAGRGIGCTAGWFPYFLGAFLQNGRDVPTYGRSHWRFINRDVVGCKSDHPHESESDEPSA
jgi:hypothetical protein